MGEKVGSRGTARTSAARWVAGVMVVAVAAMGFAVPVAHAQDDAPPTPAASTTTTAASTPVPTGALGVTPAGEGSPAPDRSSGGPLGATTPEPRSTAAYTTASLPTQFFVDSISGGATYARDGIYKVQYQYPGCQTSEFADYMESGQGGVGSKCTVSGGVGPNVYGGSGSYVGTQVVSDIDAAIEGRVAPQYTMTIYQDYSCNPTCETRMRAGNLTRDYTLPQVESYQGHLFAWERVKTLTQVYYNPYNGKPSSWYGTDEEFYEVHDITVFRGQKPTAGFSHEVDATDAKKITFTSTSVDPENGPLQYRWAFGDGTSSSAANPVHTYATAGAHEVTLTVTDNTGQSDSVTRTVGGPDFKGDVFRLDGLGPELKKDAEADVRLRVQNSGDTDLKNLGVTKIAVARTSTLPDGDPEPRKPTVTGPIDDGLTKTLSPTGAGSLDFADYHLAAHDAGTFNVTFTVRAEDPDGKAVTRDITWEVTVRDVLLEVELTLDPAEFTMTEDDPGAPPEPTEVTATLRFKNKDDEALTDITLRELDVHRTVVGQPLDVVQTGGIQPDPADPEVTLPALAAGATSAPITATFQVNDDGEIDFDAMATAATSSGGTTIALAKARLSAKPTKYIDIRSHVVNPPSGKLLNAGGQIIVQGTVKNLSNTAKLDLGPLYPLLEGNASSMNVNYDGPAPNPTVFQPAPPLRLEPGESRTFEVRIRTNYSDPTALGAKPSGGTRARITFEPWGRAVEADGTEKILRTYTKNAPGGTPDGQVKTTPGDLHHEVGIDDSIALPETSYTYLGAAIFKGAVEGVLNAGISLVYGLVDIAKMPYTVLRAAAEYQSKVWDSFTPEEREQFLTENSFLIVSILQRNVQLGLKDSKELYDQVYDYTGKMLTGMANEWETGDYAGTAEAYAKFGGEAIGSVALPFALTKLAQTPKAAAALGRLQAAVQTRMAPVFAQAREIRYVESALPLLKALENGAELPLEEIAKLYGIAPDEVAELQRLATKYKFLLTVRSRHASSVEWIQKFGAMLKPEALKIKSVSELDVKLGYRAEDLGSLVFKKPVPLQTLEKQGGQISQIVEQFIQSKGFVKGTKEYDNAINRMADRISEWGKYEKEYKSWNDRGWVQTDFNYEGNAIPDLRTKGEKGKFTGFKLQEVGDDEFVVRLLNGKTGKYVRVTGDIDPIAFTHLDGSPLTAAEHKALLDEMRKSPLLLAQHGESATFKKGGVDFVLSQFKPNEPGLQFAPNGLNPRVVRLDPSKSQWINPEDYHLHWEGGYVDAGAEAGRALPGPADPEFNRIPLGVPATPGKAQPITSSAGAATLGRCTVTVANGPGAVGAFVAANGVITTVDPASGQPVPSPLATTCFAEGELTAVTVAPSTAIGGSGSADQAADVRAFSATRAVAVGATQIPVRTDPGLPKLGSGNGFVAGQQIVIGAGTDHPEVRTIAKAGGGRIVVDRPLDVAHDDDEVIVMSKAAPQAPPVTTTTTATPTPSTTTAPTAPSTTIAAAGSGSGGTTAPSSGDGGASGGDGALPRTGSDARTPVILGLVLVLGGLVLTASSRWRRRRAA
jgi:PKD repeat protein